MARAFIVDRWTKKDGTPTAAHGARKESRYELTWDEETYAADGTMIVKRRRRGFRRKKDAADEMDRLNTALREGTYRPPEAAQTRFSQAAAQWMRTRIDVKGATLHRYQRDLDVYVLPKWGHVKLGLINRAAVEAWIGDLTTGTAPAGYLDSKTKERVIGTLRAPLAPSGVKHAHMILSAVLAWAVDVNLIPSNPAARVKRPRVQKDEPVHLDHREVEALATAAQGVTGSATDRAMVLFLAYAGVRVGEATALRVGDVGLFTCRARIRQTWTRTSDGDRVLGTPKTHQRRAVPLPRFVVDELRPLIDGRPLDAYVFRAARGGAINDHNWRIRVFNRAVVDADLEGRGLTPHKLRHTAASSAIAAGADVMVVSQMLGHADARETLNTYAHLWDDRLGEVSDAMEAARERQLFGGARENQVHQEYTKGGDSMKKPALSLA